MFSLINLSSISFWGVDLFSSMRKVHLYRVCMSLKLSAAETIVGQQQQTVWLNLNVKGGRTLMSHGQLTFVQGQEIEGLLIYCLRIYLIQLPFLLQIGKLLHTSY